MRARYIALLLWAWFCIAFMTPEIGLFVNLVLGNVVFAVLWRRARSEAQAWLLAADAWEDAALAWKAEALSWQHIALRPTAPTEFVGKQQ